MPPCPNLSSIVAVLDGKASTEMMREIETHLSTCSACRERLESVFSAKGIVPSGPALSLQPETLSPALSEALRAVRRSPPNLAELPPFSVLPDASTIFGDYELFEEIGRGGMGVVYRAKQEISLGRLVAVKMISAGNRASPSAIQRFRTEAEAAANLDHPNIVPIHEIGEHEGRHFFSMKLVEGHSLADSIKNKTLQAQGEETTGVALLATVARAVHHAHQRGVIHRDLKPSNILIDHDGHPQLTDFGLAKLMQSDAGMTLSQDVMGTPNYMSPEQAEGHAREVTPASDIFSLGAILYELLTGQKPFQGATAVDTLNQVVRCDPLPPRLLNRQIPADLETICLKSLEKEPERRYASSQEMAEELERFLRDEPIQARPAGAGEKLWRWARRNPKLSVLAASVAVLLMAMAAVSTVAAIRIAAARAGEKTHRLNAEQNARAEAIQRKEAEEQRDRAVRAEGEARDVLRFFQQKVLAATRPEGQGGGLGREVTIRAAIDSAEPDISRAFTNRPLVEASIREVLGATYHDLGATPQALAQHQRAFELYTAHLGSNHLETIESLNQVGRAHLQDVDAVKARRIFEDARERLIATVGREHKAIGPILNNIGTAWLKMDSLSNAMTWFEEALRVEQATLGTNSPEVLTVMNNLASAYHRLGRSSEAIAMLEETVHRRKQVIGPAHPFTLVSINNLALYYQREGRMREAMVLYRETVDLQQARLGPDHRDTLVAVNNLATALTDLGRVAESLALLTNTLERYLRVYGPDDGGVKTTLNNMGHALLKDGKPDDAAKIFEDILDAARGRTDVDTNSSSYISITANLAATYQKARRYSEALPLIEDALQRTRARLGEAHRTTLREMNNLAVVYQEMNRGSEAAALHERVLEIARTNLNASHPYVLTWRRNLAIDYQNMGRVPEAVALFEDLFKFWEKKDGPNSSETVRARTDLAGAYLLAGRYEDAERAYEVLRTLERKKQASEIALAETTSRIAESLLGQGRFAEAEQLIRPAVEVLQDKQPERNTTRYAHALLGWALLGQKNFDAAERLLVTAYDGLNRSASEPYPRFWLLHWRSQTVERLVELCEASGRPSEAAAWREKRR